MRLGDGGKGYLQPTFNVYITGMTSVLCEFGSLLAGLMPI